VDTTLDRTVALKVLAPHLLWDPTFVQRFQREAEVSANLDHPHIVTIYEVSQIEGVYLIAMQFLAGRTLSQLLEAEGPLPVSRVQAIIEQLVSALDYAHARGFVHRDIKPSNIMVADDGRATLTDFGLVKAGEGTQLTASGMVFGTPEYMSPEQAEGKVLDAQSDIYSLGVVLYEMLAGRAPFVADTTPAVMYKHVHEPPPLEELPSDLPQGVVAVVEKALAKKGEDRFASAGEMAAALQRAVSGAVAEEVKAPSPVMAPLPETPTLVRPEAARPGLPWKWVAGIGAVVVVVALCVVVGLVIALESGGKPTARPTSTPEAAALAPTATPTTAPTNTPTPAPPISTPLPPTAAPVARVTTPAPSELIYMPLSLTSIANEYMSGGYTQPPVGKVELGDVLFDLPPGRNSVTTQAAPLPDYPTRVEITADISQPRRVYLLITGGDVFEKYMGQRIGMITLFFGGGETSLPLIAGENIREWKILESEPVVQTVTDPAVQQVWSTPSKFDGIGIIDMLTIDVPVEYQSDRLLAITVEDTSVETVGDKDPAINLLGVTVLRQS
jgi:hypothetical protein